MKIHNNIQKIRIKRLFLEKENNNKQSTYFSIFSYFVYFQTYSNYRHHQHDDSFDDDHQVLITIHINIIKNDSVSKISACAWHVEDINPFFWVTLYDVVCRVMDVRNMSEYFNLCRLSLLWRKMCFWWDFEWSFCTCWTL